MNYSSVGDLALTFQQRRQNVQIKTDLGRLSQELASGRKADLSTTVAGDYSPIVSIERSLRAAGAYATALTEAELFTSTMQSSLEMVQNTSSELAPSLLTASSSGHTTFLQTTATDAETKLAGVVSALNTRIADRSTFAGAATGGPALADSETMLTALQTAISAETTAVGVAAAIDDWFFAPGGGFETSGYLGSMQPVGRFRLSDFDTETVALTAADPAIRGMLKGFAMAVMSGDGRSGMNAGERLTLARMAGESLLGSESKLAVVRSGIGSAQARIDTITARNASETTSLEIARSQITAIDPYKTATEMEAVRNQLETLYTLTARLSRLSLVDFLR